MTANPDPEKSTNSSTTYQTLRTALADPDRDYWAAIKRANGGDRV